MATVVDDNEDGDPNGFADDGFDARDGMNALPDFFFILVVETRVVPS